MKYISLLFLLFFSVNIYSQTNSYTATYCYKIVNGIKTPINCDDIPVYPEEQEVVLNPDSVCDEMEKLFVAKLNEWRRNRGIHELEYDTHMERVLTNPHNRWQVKAGKIAHGEGDRSFHDIVIDLGLKGVGECVAYNQVRDEDGESKFFIQYKNSPPHWSILTNEFYHYISVSVLYDKEKNRYYSTVNVRQ
jgi:uncharacterized protein YkwD